MEKLLQLNLPPCCAGNTPLTTESAAPLKAPLAYVLAANLAPIPPTDPTIAPDARALREYYAKVQPDIEMKFIPEDDSYTGEGIAIPISLNFFWPDAGV